ncbi:hypothetical protein ATI45_0998 [Marinobacter sp. LV10MA510-1]|uniref:DUF192 domain-containing protein n=1 Tax=Marinobacter sp. LV10R520-4 TaxID=1761796 RepID=UPI000BF841A0|nr:DUF192 domain-containing protein [Marinobacter sp. LV10R520-4]PFG08695.1 hypothetical protein ATI45_0998 [Marinobacter sp. LV10MA510-1]PFG54527.1 hypothetical protein ATG98_3787 [Marinobacter sp. LV10R520-4]
MNLVALKPRLIALSVSLLMVACTTGAQALESQLLPAQAACFLSNEQSIAVSLEWAETTEQRRIGLMGRETLEERSGMLFNYGSLQPAENSFWMRNTLIALDIAYVNEQGTIMAINRMEPCESVAAFNCPTYPAGAEFVQAVEMNAGFFSRYQLTLGDRLQTDPALCPNKS